MAKEINFTLDVSCPAPVKSKPLPDFPCWIQCNDMEVRLKKIRSSYTVQCIGFLPPFNSTLDSSSAYVHASVWNVGKFKSLSPALITFRECARELLSELDYEM